MESKGEKLVSYQQRFRVEAMEVDKLIEAHIALYFEDSLHTNEDKFYGYLKHCLCTTMTQMICLVMDFTEK